MKSNHLGPNAKAFSDDSESMGIFTLDPLHKYTIFGLREGGMGLVYLLRAADPRKKAFTYESALYKSPELQGWYKHVHRSHLAAKTIRSSEDNEAFLRELNIWITLDDPGCVPLLVVVTHKGSLCGIMPYYKVSLRDVLLTRSYDPRVVMTSMVTTIECLRNVQAKGVIHLDLKPENLLAEDQSGRLLVSDWGIANVMAS
jgi:serine/threonine protein kinase